MVEQIRCIAGVARLAVVNNVEIGARTGAINQRGKSLSGPRSPVIFPYLSFIPRGWMRLRSRGAYFCKFFGITLALLSIEFRIISLLHFSRGIKLSERRFDSFHPRKIVKSLNRSRKNSVSREGERIRAEWGKKKEKKKKSVKIERFAKFFAKKDGRIARNKILLVSYIRRTQLKNVSMHSLY